MRQSKCPICNTIVYKSKTTDLCLKCLEFIEKGKKYDDLVKFKINELETSGYIEVYIATDNAPYFEIHKNIDIGEMFNIFAELLSVDKKIYKKRKGYHKVHHLYEQFTKQKKVYMKAGHVELLEKMRNMFVEYIKHIKQQAFNDGKNQIKLLASGDISLRDIERIKE